MRDRCAICNAHIDPIPKDGTDPKHADDGWYEVYACENGHTGKLVVEEPTEENDFTRREKYSGCLRKVITA